MQFLPESETSVVLDKINVLFPIALPDEESLRKKFINFVRSPIHQILLKRRFLHVLKDISLVARKGDRIGILGKNGAGKSTLCRVVTGVYQPRSGLRTVNGKIRSILDPGACVYPELSGRENAKILIGLLAADQDIDVERVAEEALQFSGLGYFADVPVRLYSSGMYTRLCLSVVTALPADILILDEVFDGADLEFSKLVGQRIRKIISDANIVFFVSHSLDYLRLVCNKGVVLHNGEIVYSGPIEQAIESYLSIPGAALGHDQ